MNKKYRFTAEIKSAGGGGAFVEVPFDVRKEFGKGRVKVKVNFEGIEYRGSLVRMQSECHLLLIRKEIREKLGKKPGDKLNVVFEEDTEPRVVPIPEDVARIFKRHKPEKALFDSLSFTHRREYIDYVEGAKKAETRDRRIIKVIETLHSAINKKK
jgi:bifunctional DNA-binding transcriptional regulator/antitoxin component of YhaV-PrlF toxin-antitoxin module